MDQGMGSGAQNLHSVQLCHFLTLRKWLCISELSFLICEMGIALLLYRTTVETKWVNYINGVC